MWNDSQCDVRRNCHPSSVSAEVSRKMHVSRTTSLVAASFLFCSVVVNESAPVWLPVQWKNFYYHRMDLPKKCCIEGYLFDEELTCVRRNFSKEETKTEVRAYYGLSCEKANAVWMEDGGVPDWSYTTVYVPDDYCLETATNGTRVLARCPDLFKSEDNASSTPAVPPATGSNNDSTRANPCGLPVDDYNRTRRIATKLDAVVFWGAKTYMSTNMAHVVLCIVVVVTYLTVAELRKGVYNRAVLRHNICLLALGCILTVLAYCDLCECPLNDNLTIFLWLLLQYFTLATVFWLNVICFGMTLCITRFRWTMGPGANTDRENCRRMLFYGLFAWGGALLPTVIAAIFEYTPGIPTNFPLKPNYLRYRLGPNPTVNLYFFAIPLLTLFCNNVLFLFTTYKILRIQRSTKIATKNQSSVLTKKYFLFLRLYLLMGAPWFFGCLLACLNKLVILKICRLIQPILWLFMLLAPKKIRRKIVDKLCSARSDDHQGTATQATN
ncbi:hypothetical protein KPH14_006875 [Odynerus spinipes]|uniref:Uncharacterized protein n=1 Tax=Odynerus spinipes TaxID=1348599 RepID=A0AAD9RRD5_9HYME|nr:hypothetical protein KPH14_006875 [Odynerus spinipes]